MNTQRPAGTAVGVTAAVSAVVLGVSAFTAPDATTVAPPSAAQVQQAAQVAADRTHLQEVKAQDATGTAVTAAAERAAQAEAQRVAAEQAAAAAAAQQAAALEQARQAEEAASRSVRRAADPRAVAADLVAARGWDASQFGCLDSLWQKESNWQVDADNPTSSAYGIPQSLPGSKMASAGADWETNPETQIVWGLGYIEDTYGTPCSAWSHSQSNNWY